MSTDTDQEQGGAAAGPGEAESTRRPAVRIGVLWDRLTRRPAAIVAILALAAGAWAMVGSQQVFPYLSDDHDEGLYLLQADALAHGHLLPPATEHPAAFRPWLSVVRGDKFVLKYSPVHASFLAVAIRLGDVRLALGLVAGGLVILTYLLANEVLDDRRLAALASAFFAFSPLFLIQSITFLPYCSSLLLLEPFAFTLFRGLRSGGRAWLPASGFLLGLAVFARPYDAVVFAVPFGLYLLVSRRRDRAGLARTCGRLALGAALPLVAMLAYHWVATGNPLRPPFSLLEPQDTLGFGTRKLTPHHPDLVFTPSLGIYGVVRHVMLTSFWCFGGLVLVGFFLVGVLRRRPSGPQLTLALVALSLPFGYSFFWGTLGTGLRGGLTAFLGPFYFLPVLVPLTILAAKSFSGFWRWDRLIGAAALVSMLSVSGYLLVRGVQVNLRATREDRKLYSTLAPIRNERSIVFLQPIYGPNLLHPFSGLRNDHDYDGRTVYALDLGEHEDLDVLEDYPGRAVYRFRLEGGRYRAVPSDPALRSSLQPMRVVEQPRLATALSLQNPTAEPVVTLTVIMDGRRDTFVLDTTSYLGKPYGGRVSIGLDSVEVTGPVAAHAVEPVDHDGLVISLSVGPAGGLPQRQVYRRELGWNRAGSSFRALLPGYLADNDLAEDPLVDLVIEQAGGPHRRR